LSFRPSLTAPAGQAGPSPEASAPAGALLIRITGHDRPGLTHALASILARYDARILDVGQAVILDGLAVGILIEMTREGLSLEQCIAVGDGANDLPMLRCAGLGIVFRAKPVVRSSARQSISSMGLDGILYLIGVRDRDIGQGGPAR
jgi:phosphoserine phosphatase